jgi:hypothetical protein
MDASDRRESRRRQSQSYIPSDRQPKRLDGIAGTTSGAARARICCNRLDAADDDPRLWPASRGLARRTRRRAGARAAGAWPAFARIAASTNLASGASARVRGCEDQRVVVRVLPTSWRCRDVANTRNQWKFQRALGVVDCEDEHPCQVGFGAIHRSRRSMNR